MLTQAEKTAIRRSWELAAPITETVADLFYKRLFEIAPQYRALFKEDMAPQKRMLIAMLAFIVEAVDWSNERWADSVPVDEDLFLVVLALGRRHIELYRVPDEAYDAVGAALLWTLDYGLGEASGPSLEAFTGFCQDNEKNRLFETTIPRSEVFATASLSGKPLRMADPSSASPVAWLFDMLAAELVDRAGLKPPAQSPQSSSFLV